MLSTLRSTLHVEIHPAGKDMLPPVPAQSAPRDGVADTAQPSAAQLSNLDSEPASSSPPILDFIASDESLDRYDEVICASGWRLDTYRRNPVFQNAHQYGDIMFTLGKALATEVRSAECGVRNGTRSGMKSGAHLFQRIQFATEVNPVARIAYGLYKGKFLNAVSVGFIPIRWEDADGTEHLPRSTAAGRQVFQPLSLSASQHFRRRYLEELSRQRPRLAELRRRARMGTLTLVYGAKDTEHNDAVVLAEVLRRGLPRIGKETSKPHGRKGASA